MKVNVASYCKLFTPNNHRAHTKTNNIFKLISSISVGTLISYNIC